MRSLMSKVAARSDAPVQRLLAFVRERASVRYAMAFAGVVVFSLVMFPVRESLGVVNCLLGFVVLALLSGLVLGTGPSVLGAVLSFFAFDYLFIQPYNTLDVAATDHVLALFIYLAVALVTSVLIGRLRLRTEEAVREGRRTQLLYDLNRNLVRGSTLDDVLQAIVNSVVSIYGAASGRMVLRGADGEVMVRSKAGTVGTDIDQESRSLATWVIEHRQAAGARSRGRRIREPHGIGTQPRERLREREDVLFLPIQTEDQVYGALEVRGRPGGGRFSSDESDLLESFANQAALAVERGRLMDESLRVRVLEEANELKSSMLAAVSHDLRTPLTTIKASSTALLDEEIAWDEATRRDLLTAIDEDTDRLTLMVSNLLDLSRIDGGVLKPNLDWQDVAEFFQDMQSRLKTVLKQGDHVLELHLTPATDFPPVRFDYVEMMQVMLNLVGNASKYSAAGTAIAIDAWIDHDAFQVRVTDHGIGIPPHRLSHVFDTFYRVNEQGTVTGTGIGLAICRGIVEAHGGRIRVTSDVGTGSAFVFAIPVAGLDGATIA